MAVPASLSARDALRGFTLLDVMMGVTLTTVLVLLMGQFAVDAQRYRRYVTAHQRLRTEVFPMAKLTLPRLIREASAIDYAETDERHLVLFMDHLERERVSIVWTEEGQLQVDRDGEVVQLHADDVIIEHFRFDVPAHPASSSIDLLQVQRALQPVVYFSVQARVQPFSDIREQQGFFDEPRVSYQSAATLRNASLSSLRHAL